MNKFFSSTFIALLLSSGHPLLASAVESDTSDIGNANSPQQVDQANARQASHKKTGQAKYSHHCDMHKKITKMDTNNDGMISKDEFMTFHEKMFDAMQPTNGMVSIKEFEAHMRDGMKRDHMHKAN